MLVSCHIHDSIFLFIFFLFYSFFFFFLIVKRRHSEVTKMSIFSSSRHVILAVFPSPKTRPAAGPSGVYLLDEKSSLAFMPFSQKSMQN